MDYIIGMDIGTTASKGVLYQENGKKIEEMSLPYPLIQEKVDQAEEDTQVIFDAVQKIIFDLSKRVSGKIKAISWSSQMHSLIGLGKDDKALTNSITWADNRSSQLVAQAKEKGLAQDIINRQECRLIQWLLCINYCGLKKKILNFLHRCKSGLELKNILFGV